MDMNRHEPHDRASGTQDGGRRPSASSRESGSRRNSRQSEHSTISVLSLPSFFKDQSGAGADDLEYLCFCSPIVDEGLRRAAESSGGIFGCSGACYSQSRFALGFFCS